MFIAFFEARNDAGDDSQKEREGPSANVILITDAIYPKNQGLLKLYVCVCVYTVDTNKDV